MKKRFYSYFLSLKLLFDYKTETFTILFLSVISATAGGLSIGLLIPILEADSRPIFEDTPFKYLDDFIKIYSGNNFNDRVLSVSVLIILLSSIELIMSLLNGSISSKTETKIRKDFTYKSLEKLENIDYSVFRNQTSGKLFTYIIVDPNVVGRIAKKIFITFQPLILLIIYLIVMYAVSPLMTVLSILFFVLIAIISTSRISKNIANSQKVIANDLFKINSEVQETLDNFKNIVSHGILKEQIKRLHLLFEDFFKVNYKLQRDSMFLIPVNNFVNSFGIATLLIAGTFVFRDQDNNWTALLIPFLILLFKLLPAISQVNSLRVYIESNFVYIERIKNFLSLKHLLIDHGEKEFGELKNSIIYKNVNFKYDNSNFSLQNFNLEIPANSTTGIIGVSGSGKTTMIDLLLKIYLPTSGNIFFDETDINEIKNSSLRNKISYVSQDALFFNRSIEENLNLLNENNKDFSKLFKTMSMSYFDEIKDSIMGSGGVNLSSGQKQKFNFVRAYLKDSEILILDEPTSNLDFESQNILKEYIREINGEKTILLITHTPELLDLCDSIAVIKDGLLETSGTKLEVSKNSSYFNKMINEK